MIRLFFSFLFLLCLAACGEPRYNFDVKGADEFVMDSYKIRQGKFAILQMQGIPVAPMPPDAMKFIVSGGVTDLAETES